MNNWDKVTFNDVFDKLEYGLSYPAKRFDGKNKYIRITDINDDSNKFSKDDLVSPDGELKENYKIKENDILFARTGASVGKTYIFNPEDVNTYYAGFLIRGNVLSKFNSKIIFYNTLTNAYKKWVRDNSMRSGQPGLNSKQYSSYEFMIPSDEEEQNQIACSLTNIDNLIEEIKKQIDKISKIKIGMVDSLMKNNNDRIKLSDYVYFNKGTQLNESEVVPYGKFYHLNGGINPSNYTNKYNAEADTISISEGGNSCGYVNWNSERFFSGGHNYTVNFKTENIDHKYLYYILKHNQNSIMNLRVGSGLPNIQKKDLENFEVCIDTNIDNQKNIVKVLSDFDNMLDKLNDKLKKYKNIKSGIIENILYHELG